VGILNQYRTMKLGLSIHYQQYTDNFNYQSIYFIREIDFIRIYADNCGYLLELDYSQKQVCILSKSSSLI